MKLPRWLVYTLAVPALWGAWGALTELPEKWIAPPFPATLGYTVWSLTMIPVALYALNKISWKPELDLRSISYGCAVGFSGAAGQLMLFWVLTRGPAYIVFPIICLSPAITILFSVAFLRERTQLIGTIGILLSLVAILLLSIQQPDKSPVQGHIWLVAAIGIFLLWGLQAYFIKSSANSISPEGLLFYMTLTGIALSPIALLMTDFSHPINRGFMGGGLTALIQSLNAWGCLFFVFAVRFGKAIIVVPMVNGLFPVVTIILSLLLYRTYPSGPNLAGMLVAVVAILLMAVDEVRGNGAIPGTG
jgi:uncharacterized membrane protein